MLLGVDHLVIAVPDPDVAAGEIEEALGLVATGGGRHDTGTWNRLVFLGDTYLELIGVWDAIRAADHPIGAAALATLGGSGAGLATLALATDGVAGEAAALQAAGSAISSPVAGSRLRPDGARVAWQVAFSEPLGPARPPFLIEHEMEGAEWGADARVARARFRHPFGGTAQFVGLELVRADPLAVAEAWGATVGVRFVPAPAAGPGARETRVGAHRVRLIPATAVRVAPPVTIGIRGSIGPRVLVDLLGVRFVRL